MYYNYTGVLWNIQRRLQHLQNIKFDTQIDEFGQFCKIYLFVPILENGRHPGFSIDQSDGMDLIYYRNVTWQHTAFFVHIAYFCRAWDDSHEFTRGMLN